MPVLDLKNPEGVKQYVKDKDSSSIQMRQAFAARSGTDAAYSEGVQWLNYADLNFINTSTGRSFLPVTVNPDSKRLRVIMNILTKRLYKVDGATWPSKMVASIDPPLRDGGVEASCYSQTMEDLYQAWIKASGLIGIRQQVNHRRTINGVHGMILRRVTGTRELSINGKTITVPDVRLEADDFHALRLILDPAIPNRDLRRHEEILWHDVWSVYKLRAMFPGISIDVNKLKTIGQLTPFEQNMSSLSGGRLFGYYRQYSNTKGARVYQVHAKDETGNWGIMYSAVDIGEAEWYCPNLEEPVTTFGGDGLPMVLYHGHQRADSPYSISDAALGKDAQDMLNIAMTQHVRAMRIHTGYNVVVDQNWFGDKVSDEDMSGVIHNLSGGIIRGKPRSKDAQPPQWVRSPAPSPHMLEMVDRMKEDLLDSMFRSEVDLGVVKTHVTKDNTAKALAASGQILGIRVEEDLNADAQIGTVALGTLIDLAKKQSPSVLGMMRESGFDEQDIGVVLSADPKYPTCNLTISPSSIRYRSPDEVRDSLMALAGMAVPAIDGDTLTKGLADIDMPASEDDAHMRQELAKAITNLLRGQPWEPLPLGPKYGKWCIIELERALFDKRARTNPQIRQAVVMALQQQQQVMVQQQIQSDPNLVVQQQQMQSQERQSQMEAQAPPEQAQGQAPSNIGQMFDQLAGAR